ncbi:PorT family protein [Gelidibacter salicanalis]|uniref:PorT family protein n=1 Tax=Gelidibacter salicanalis TaxID=291193 RepID=A0A5C7AS35_9FLAO|nr:porin family protein [Gelidibacter salicanalis]TXE09305.1 PorT family protein [Gelidibacter salicanalis]
MKTFMTLVTVIGMIMVAQAQQDIQFGVKGGLNIASIYGADAGDAQARTSFHGGIMIEIPVFEKLSFQPELLYTSLGTKEDDNSELRLDYLTLPMMVKYYVADNFSLEIGPQIGILLSAESKVEGEGEGDAKEFFKDFDAALNLGIGYKFDNGLNLGARYNLGLIKIIDLSDFFSDGFFSDDGDIKAYNSVVQISVGYFF